MKNKWRLFFSNAIMLSIVNIVMRGIAVSFNSYVNLKIGAESMGLFTLVMSVYGFAVTVALSCVNLASVRHTSERCAALEGADKRSWKYAMRRVVRSVCIYSLLFGVASAVVLYFTSGIIAKNLLNDIRTLKSLKILAFSLPAISLSSALSGYFTGLRKVIKNAVVTVSEQFIKIFVTSTALVFILPGNVESACLAVVGGSAIAEAWSLVMNVIMYVCDSGRPFGVTYGKRKVRINTRFKSTADISLPSAIGTYARQGLTTLEHLAIPKGMVRGGISREKALASYGLLQGIAFPLVMFPYAIITSFTSLLLPEIAEQNERKDMKSINNLTLQVYKYSAVFSIGACGIFANFANELGSMVFHSTEAARYTLLLGLLVPFMYLDTAVDSLLKGLGEQVYTMKVNIIDAASGLILVMILTPIIGIYGYILTIWLCEVGNLWASIHKLSLVTGISIRDAIKQYVKPLMCCVTMSIASLLIKTILNPVISIIVFGIGYIVLTYFVNNFREKVQAHR
ncbi:MAG: hypothetical protein E7628_06665 [Ruminococcaceae bacterium]|nr:hypothetical protein [Oscillospiraceae bacterium]